MFLVAVADLDFWVEDLICVFFALGAGSELAVARLDLRAFGGAWSSEVSDVAANCSVDVSHSSADVSEGSLSFSDMESRRDG